MATVWGFETHRLAEPMPPNWRVGEKKEGLYRLEIGSEIDLVTWERNGLGGLPAAGTASEGAYTVSTVIL